MARKAVSYKLNQDGSVPNFIEDGGYFSNSASITSDTVLIGISVPNLDESKVIQVFNTEQELYDYVNTYTPASWENIYNGQTITLYLTNSISNFWSKLDN
jgi:hypothetical protein